MNVTREDAENGILEFGTPESDRPNSTKNGRNEIGRFENEKPNVEKNPVHEMGRPVADQMLIF